MKLVRQALLHFQEGTSDKVYEVDLCEVGDGQYVVNFRYGRRGSNLRDGTKTALPVSLDKATKIYDKLVESKVKKGYIDSQAEGGLRPPRTPGSQARGVPETSTAPGDLHPRERRIVSILANPGTRGDWPLPRVIWRAGQLRIRAAAPHIARLSGGQGLLPYICAWALGRCGDPSVISTVQHLRETGDDKTRRIATEAMRALLTGPARDDFLNQQLQFLPAGLAAAAATDDEAAFRKALDRWLSDGPGDRMAVLERLYLLDAPWIRGAVLDAVVELPVAPPAFRTLRHLLKAAEFRGDGELWGLIVRRIELEKHTYSSPHWGRRIWHSTHGSLSVDDESARDNSRLAFSSATRKYLRRSAWRILRKLGEGESPEFADMAAGVLLAYSDADAGPSALSRTDWWGNTTTTRLDPFGHSWAFCEILYGDSLRLRKSPSLWHSPGVDWTPELPSTRTEPFQAIWDRSPKALVRLLAGSRCAPVQNFAALALRANPGAWASVPLDALESMLGLPYERTVDLAIDIAKDRYDPNDPQLNLVVLLASCALERGRSLAHEWIRANPAPFLADVGCLAALVLSTRGDTRRFARDLLASSVVADDVAGPLVVALIEAAVAMTEDADRERCHDLSATLSSALADHARTVPLEWISKLIAHELLFVQEVGARLLLGHAIPAKDLPDELLAAVMTSDAAVVRGIGVKLFGNLPDDVILDRFPVVLHLCTHPLSDVRAAVRPLVARLAADHSSFRMALFAGVLVAVGKPEQTPGLHADLVALMRGPLAAALAACGSNEVFLLLQSPSTAVQELGGHLLAERVDPAELAMEQIAVLGDNPVLAVREAAWSMYRAQVDRVRAELEDALKLLNASWDDTRAFAFDFLRTEIRPEDWTPTLLVSVCDSVRHDVQRFGRERITALFAEEHGVEYLVKLSQHPTPNMQLFASNYLARFAGGDLDRIRSLRPYFRSVLCQVNRARPAKTRVLAFLRTEARRDEASARFVAELLTDLSMTIAIGDRAAAVEILVEISTKHPDIDVPLVHRPFERRARAV